MTQLRSVSALMPNCSAIRFNAPVRVAGSRRASTASRVARSRSSSGYFLGAATTLILTWIESLHQTRGGTNCDLLRARFTRSGDTGPPERQGSGDRGREHHDVVGVVAGALVERAAAADQRELRWAVQAEHLRRHPTGRLGVGR